jgi:pyrroline-5-carboxylate reductase
MTAVAIIGGGKMGEALLAGLLGANHSVVVCEPDELRAASLRKKYGISTGDPRIAVENSDVVLLAVKPAMVGEVLGSVGDAIPVEALVISVAAGITTAALESGVAHGIGVVRAMPNTPALVGQGMTVLSAGRSCTPEQLEQAQELLAAVGKVAVVPEAQQDAVTALSGSGPAYVFFVVEAMIDAAIALGLDSETARELAIQTAYGAATMLRETGDDPVELRENVTSPGGTTAAALERLEAHEVREAFIAALTAAKLRSAELASE